MRKIAALVPLVASLVTLASALSANQPPRQAALIELWNEGKAAFGIFVPNEAPRMPPPTTRGNAAPAGPGPARGPMRGPGATPVYTSAGAAKLAANPLYDYLFLNLEGAYDAAAVRAVAEGLRSQAATGVRKALIVRVPAFHEEATAGRERLREVFAAGADGITFPHVETVEEAQQILAAAQAEKINVWSPENKGGDKLVMLMLEDPKAVAQARAFADLKGFSILACGIGSLRGALKGDAAGAEAGVQRVLAETKRTRLVNMLTATTQDVKQRVGEGFLGILAQGQDADEAIRMGKVAAGRVAASQVH